MTEYDSARMKHLGHKANPRPKWRKGDDAEKIHSDMVAAQVQHAAFCCMPECAMLVLHEGVGGSWLHKTKPNMFCLTH